MDTSHSNRVCYDVWSTALGPMGAVADGGELIRLVLPHARPERMLAELARRHRSGRRDRDALGGLRDLARAYFDGETVDFGEIPCRLPPAERFAGLVLRACRAIPYGQTACYRALAVRVGNARAARAVASALSRNPIPLVVPCHRVIRADGRLGGFSAARGVEMKRQMLGLEGIEPAP